MLPLGSGRTRAISKEAAMEDPPENAVNDQDDDPRIAIQNKSFRRWCNSFLNKRGMHVNNLFTDFADGVLLINLMEQLAETRLGRYNKRPKIVNQKMENINLALKFISSHVKLVNVGASDIHEGNRTIISGLIWTLVLRWQLRLSDGKSGLLEWVQNRTKPTLKDDIPTNFTKSWQDGRSFAALVHSFVPDDMDHPDNCDPANAVETMIKSFAVAEDKLGITKLLDPADVYSKPDEKSIVTYVAQFLGAEERLRKQRDDAAAQAKLEESEPPPAPKPPKLSNPTSTTVDAETRKNPKRAAKIKIEMRNESEEWGDPSADLRVEIHPVTKDETESMTFGDLIPSTVYFARAIAISPQGLSSEPSEEVSITTEPILPPTRPRILDASPSSLQVEWEPVRGAAKYIVQSRAPDFKQEWANARNDETRGTSVTLKYLPPDTTFEVRVVAVTARDAKSEPGVSETGQTVAIPSPAPPHADDATKNSIMVWWEPQPDSVKSLQLLIRKRVSKNDDTSKIPWDRARSENFDPNEGAGASSPVTVGELEPGTKYELALVAVTEDGMSAPSEPPTKISTLAAPNVRVQDTTDRSACIVWSPVPDTNHYTVDLRDTSNSKARPRQLRRGGDATKATVTELGASAPHEVVVTAHKADGTSVASDAVSFNTKAPSGRVALVTGSSSAGSLGVLRDVLTGKSSLGSFTRVVTLSEEPESDELKGLASKFSSLFHVVKFSHDDDDSFAGAAGALQETVGTVDVVVNSGGLSREQLGRLLLNQR